MNSNDFIIRRLEWPAGRVDVVLDTDTYNEVDDQFALAYLLRSGDRLNLKAVFAAPFQNEKAATPALGMEKSYQEILKILALCGRPELTRATFRGSKQYLPDEDTPVLSPAAEYLIQMAMERPDDQPLYVLAIGAITNIASAILIQPEITKKIVVVWLGGNASFWPDTREFNMSQDIAAARVLFGCGVPVVQLPCMGVVTHLATTGPELEYWMSGKNELCDYLYGIVKHDEETVKKRKVWNRVIWDISTVAWLLDERYTDSFLTHSPIPTYEGLYSFDERRHFIRYVFHVNRDLIFADLFEKLARSVKPEHRFRGIQIKDQVLK